MYLLTYRFGGWLIQQELLQTGDLFAVSVLVKGYAKEQFFAQSILMLKMEQYFHTTYMYVYMYLLCLIVCLTHEVYEKADGQACPALGNVFILHNVESGQLATRILILMLSIF